MSWVRLEDNMVDHPKIIGLSDRAFRLWITSLSYANRHQTDGKLERKIAEKLSARGLGARKELVSAGLWDENGTGFYIHDYLEYQPSKAENCDLREKRAAAGRIGGMRSKRKASAWASAEAKTNPDPSPLVRSKDQEDLRTDSDEAGTPAHILALLRAIGETEHSSCHAELLSWKARGASEHDFREATRALSQRRPRDPRAYAAKIIANKISEKEHA